MVKAAEDVFEEVEENTSNVDNYIRDVAEWFHEREGEMFEKEEAVEKLQRKFDIEEELAARLIGELVGDKVDPVVQVKSDNTRYIGVVDFKEFDGAYGYIDYNDVRGKQKKAVCAQCVKKAETDSEATFVSSSIGDSNSESIYTELVDKIHGHYNRNHMVKPAKVKTGATLASGTTIGGNISWHAGNDGSGSGLDADTVDGAEASDISYSDSDARSAVNGSDTTLQTLTVNTNNRSSTEDIKLNANANISSDNSIFFLNNNSSGNFRFGVGDTIQSGNESYHFNIKGDGTVNAETGPLQENGNRVATRNWVGNNYNNYSDSDARNAVEGSTLNSLNLNRSGLNAADSWLEINGGSSGILANYNDKNEFRHYGNVYMYSNADIYMQNNDVNGARRVSFNNSEHSDLNNRSIGWDDSEGGSGSAGGLIYQDSTGDNLWVVNSSERDYDIQKNGSDTNGVINFKT